jgi:hypothetical protein
MKRKPARRSRCSSSCAAGGRAEAGDQHDGDEIGRGVDQQDRRRADDADQDPGQRRPGEQRRPRRGLEERLRLGDALLLLAEQLRDDHLLRGKVRRGERAERERDDEQGRVGQAASPVQDRYDGHQRRSRPVAEQHRATRPEPAEHTPARQSEESEPDHFGGDHEGRLRRRAGRQQDEPRQRHPGHLRAGGRDHLGRQQRDDRPLAEHFRATHSSASGSSRRCGIGEGSSQSTPAIAPTVAIQSVGRRPIQVPSAPPASAPSGRTP